MIEGKSGLPFHELLSVKNPPNLGSEAVDRVLHALRDHLEMDVAFVAEFRQRDRVFRHVDARNQAPIRTGDAIPLEQGYCQRVVDGRLPQLIPDTSRVPDAMALPETLAVPIGSHISVPIRLGDGRLFGTLCCFSFSPDTSLGERDLKMMKVFAALLGDQIDRDTLANRQTAAKVQRVQLALSAAQPTMAFQPIFDLARQSIAGVEALARFQIEPQRPPNEWFAEAADAGMGPEMELAAMEAALRDLPGLPPGVYMSLNCSPATLLSGALAGLLQTADIARVVLEITEHDYIQDYPALLAALAPLRAMGMRVAIDDAGAGYASLRHVLHIQPELIKLDISLTRNIDVDPKRRALASALIAFGRETQARIVAEGVETQAELATLRQLGAACAQGYFLARPSPLQAALRQPFPGASSQILTPDTTAGNAMA